MPSMLSRELLDEEFSEEDYTYLFTFRCTKWIEKLERTKAFFAKMDAKVPRYIYDAWDKAITDTEAVKTKYGDEIKPGDFKG